jgi:4-amino-4-deoxy-L-arabinose transferase-like glycosyltransferase
MRETGDWIVPHLNRAIYAEKPPLFFWLVNLFTFFLGENTEFSNRLTSALAGFSAMLLTFLFGSKLCNPRSGFLSALILATTSLFPQLSRWMMLDSLFTFLFLLSLFCFYRGLEIEERRPQHYLFAGLFMGLGVLTKGPISYLSIPVFLIFAFVQKELKGFWNRHLLMGFILSITVVLIWLVPACWIGGESYTKTILFGQTLGRLAGGEKHFHVESFFFYFIRFPIEFFPWIVFLPTAFIFGFRKGKDKTKGFLFLSIWFIFIFLFFTLSRGKKDNYLLPLYPAAAMMVGVLWDSELQSLERRKGFVPGLSLLTFLFLVGFILFLSGIAQKSYPIPQIYRPLGISILPYLFIGSLLSLLFFMKEKRWASFLSLAVTFAIFHLHISFALPSKLNSQRSMKPFAERILKRMEPGDEIKTYWFKSNGLIYYTKKPYIEEIETPDRFIEVFRSPHRVFIVVLLEMSDKLKRDTGIGMDPIDQVKVGHWNYILISNH